MILCTVTALVLTFGTVQLHGVMERQRVVHGIEKIDFDLYKENIH